MLHYRPDLFNQKITHHLKQIWHIVINIHELSCYHFMTSQQALLCNQSSNFLTLIFVTPMKHSQMDGEQMTISEVIRYIVWFICNNVLFPVRLYRAEEPMVSPLRRRPASFSAALKFLYQIIIAVSPWGSAAGTFPELHIYCKISDTPSLSTELKATEEEI